MATTKKPTTKAKTKTASAKASTKKTTVRKTVPKKAAVKAAATKTSSKAASSKPITAQKTVTAVPRVLNIQRLRGLHAMTVGVFLLLAVAAATLMDKVSYQLTVGHIAKDELTGGMAPAVQAIYDVEVRWLVVAALVLAAVLPVLYLTKLQNRYAEYVTNTRMQPWRWVDFAVTGALGVEVVALLSGVSDIATLKLVGGLVATTAILGLIAERQNNAVTKPVRSAFYASLFTGAVVAAFTAAYAVASAVYGTGVDWYVYTLYAVSFGGFALLARNLRKQLSGANYLVVERNYIVLNMLVKAAFAVVLIVGLLRNF